MNELGISKLDVKRRNRMQILRIIRENGAISRVDIASILHLTRAAVTIIANEMLADKILIEVGSEPLSSDSSARKGRRKMLLDINPTYRFALGAYIGSDCLSVGLTTLKGDTIEHTFLPLAPEISLEEITHQLLNSIVDMLKKSALSLSRVMGFGIGVMPSLWERLGVQAEAHRTDFSAPARYIERKVSVPVFMGNAISLLALSDIHPMSYNRAALYAGENGYYVNILLQSQLHDAFQRSSNPADRLCVNPGGRSCEGCCDGSVKAELSPTALAQKTASVYGRTQTPCLYRLTEGNGERIMLAQLLEAYLNGDSALNDIAEEVLSQFGFLLHNLSEMLFAERISLYHFGFTSQHMECLRSHMERHGAAETARKIVVSDIGEEDYYRSCCLYAIEMGFFQSGGRVI